MLTIMGIAKELELSNTDRMKMGICMKENLSDRAVALTHQQIRTLDDYK